MNLDYKNSLKRVHLTLLTLFFAGTVLTAQTALNLTNDTRANDRYCDINGRVFTGCGGSYTDDGGIDLYSDDLIDVAAQNSPANNYGDDSYEPILWTFCPDNPVTEKIKLTFTVFDIHVSDQFYVYDGACELANGDKNPNIGFMGLDDDNQLDTSNLVQFSGSSPGQMSRVTGDGTVLYGAGWVEASCQNVSGCITIGWNPNGDSNKGLGWLFSTACAPRTFDISCPITGDGNAPNGIASYDGLTIGCGENTTLPVPAVAIDGCAGSNNNLLSPPYMVEVIIDGLSLGFVGGDLAEYPEMTVGVGRHTLSYVLYFDKDGDGDLFDGQLEELKKIDCSFTLLDSEDLVCSAETNISLGDDCRTKLLPKEILSDLCAPAYPINIIIKGKSYAARCRTCDFLDADTNALFLVEGTHDYIIRDNCNNACFGKINLRDIQVPQCTGPNLIGVLCSGAVPDIVPNFLDCNEIIETSYEEEEYGACGQYSATEVAQLQDILNPNHFIQTSPGIYVLTGSGSSILTLTRDMPITFESITVRRWKATDSNGNTNESCPQAFINIRPDTLFMPNIPTIEVKCGDGITPEALLTLTTSDGTPRFTKQNLAPWYVNPLSVIPHDSIAYLLPEQQTNCHYATFYEDQLIQTIGKTQKISRTWKWLDWCSPTPQRAQSFVQIIKIVDDVEPELTAGPDTMRFSLNLFDCQRSEVNLLGATWNDACGAVVGYRTELRTIQADGRIGEILQENEQNGGQFYNLEVGNYYVLYYAKDQDGNETSMFDGVNGDFQPVPGNIHVGVVAIVDGVKPQTRCINQLNISLRSNQDLINAVDFDAGSSDNCGIASLGVSLSDEEGTFGSFINFSCEDVGETIRIYLQAVDIHGNKNICWGDVLILSHPDNNDCDSDEVMISGEITNENGEFLEPVTIRASTEGQADVIGTAQFGQYNLGLLPGKTYTITPEKNTDVTNGVSTYDLVLINQHVLNIKRFTSPFQYIAADVNKSGSVTAFDMLQLRQLILSKTFEFRDNTSWRFIDAKHNFGSDVSSTLSQKFAESMKVAPTQNIQANFVGVKIGDVNGTATPNLLTIEDTAEPRNKVVGLTIEAQDRLVEAGTNFDLVLQGINLEKYNGFQFTLDFPELALVDIKEDLLTTKNWHLTNPHQLITSWNGNTKGERQTLLTLKFKALTTGLISDLLQLNSKKLRAETYQSDNSIQKVELSFKKQVTRTTFELLQSHPNPTNNWATIDFNLPSQEKFVLKVIDLNGQLLWQSSGVGVKGYNQIKLQTKDLAAQGVVYYQLQTDTELAMKKMIITK
ncbi:MAG: T9SS type A sorting domain-containing protein [Saprospiraceae bacterium]